MTSRVSGIILNVNDNEASRYALNRVLENAGFEVLEAVTGEDALRLVSEISVDAVLLDLQLPGIDGYEVCRRLKAKPETSAIPVLHISAVYTSDKDWVESLEGGADGYLAQPADASILISMLRALIRARNLEGEVVAHAQQTAQMNEALRLSEERFRLALKASSIMVFNQDADLRYTWVYNPLPGWEKVHITGRTDAEVFQSDEVAAIEQLKRRVLETGQSGREEVRLTVNGEERSYDVQVEPMRGETGAVTGLTGAVVDLTESRRLEAKVRQAQKLESIGLLASGIAHDFNNLLTGIMGNASMVFEALPEDEPLREQLQEVVRAGEKAAGLTQQLMAYAGKGDYKRQNVDVTAIVRDIMGLVQASVYRGIRLELSLRDNLPPVEADASQLQQIVMNLLINAAEAIGDAGTGTIRINTGEQAISRKYIERNSLALHNDITPGAYVYLEVRDTGCGMDDDTRARMFDPFFSTKFAGRGLGLAAVQGIVRSHRGTIEVYSASGRGTTFRVLFPAAAERAADRTAEPAPADFTASGTILVVDDEAVVRGMARRALERKGFSVVLAEDGERALAIFREQAAQIDAVLLDIAMPGISGIEVMRRLREIRPDIKVLLSSGYNQRDILGRFPVDPGTAFVQKPYTAGGLALAVRAALAS